MDMRARLLGASRRNATATCAVAAVSMLSLFTSACATEEAEPPAGADPVFVTVWEEADQAGASLQQLDLLSELSEQGEVKYSDVQRALTATFECLEAAGFFYYEMPYESVSGLLIPGYSFGKSGSDLPPEDTRIADECIETHSFYVEKLYQIQPVAVEAEEQEFAGRRTEIVECLEAKGVEVDPGATRDEIYQAAVSSAGFDPQGQAPEDSEQLDTSVLDCLTAS